MSTAIHVEGIGKQYRIGAAHVQHDTLGEQLAALASAPFRRVGRLGARLRGSTGTPTIWALRDVGFDVAEGEVIGIVGRNGAGKSTLLKILSRITEPTEGRAEIHGRVGSLLEVGTGFHPELTGRENISLNGAILGMRKTEIGSKFDEIVAFAELEKFIDTPVKRYSSGMYVRLAFAVAAHLEPEILLVDEVLAVGDSAFQKKCLGKMSEVAHGGRTILFVSHNMGAVAELCTRGILLHEGAKVAEGNVADVIEAYSRLLGKGEHTGAPPEDPTLPASIVEYRLENASGRPAGGFDIADELAVTLRYRVRERLQALQLTATLARNLVDVVHSFDTDNMAGIQPTEAGLYETQYRVPGMFLKAGVYSVRFTLGTPDRLLQDIEGAIRFELEETSVNTHMKGYRKDRPGHVISPGTWATTRVGDA